jgi:hypothetical protein
MNSEHEQSPPATERFWTAKEWSQRSRISYRTILAAAARGELVALRPSRAARGQILISEANWQAWLEGSPLRVRVTRPEVAGSQDLAELAIGGSR